MESIYLLNIAHLITLFASVSTLCVTLWVERKNRKNQENIKYIEEKLKVYEPFVKNLRHSLSLSAEDFKKFQQEILEDNYYSFWLYASDNTLILFNKLVDTRCSKKRYITHEHLVDLYKDLFLEIRKDIFPDSKLELNDIRVLINYSKE